MKDDTCIFCKLANGDIPTNMIYEDELFAVIMDASPASKGHALILPKEHYANVYELPEETAAAAFVLAKKLAGKISAALGCDGMNILQNNGTAAGQTVFHFHMHLIPRYESGSDFITWNQAELSEEEKTAVYETLKKACQ